MPGIIALTTIPTRQFLMPAINLATDNGAKTRFKVLHGLSVIITLAHIAAAGVVLARFARNASSNKRQLWTFGIAGAKQR